MDFTDQSARNRYFGQPSEAVIHGAGIVHHFVYVVRSIRREYPCLGLQQVLQLSLHPFNMARQHGLFADVRENEQIRIRQCLYGLVETAQRAVGLGEQGLQLSDNTPEGDDHIAGFGGAFGFAVEGENSEFGVGVSWINHIGDSDSLRPSIEDYLATTYLIAAHHYDHAASGAAFAGCLLLLCY